MKFDAPEQTSETVQEGRDHRRDRIFFLAMLGVSVALVVVPPVSGVIRDSLKGQYAEQQIEDLRVALCQGIPLVDSPLWMQVSADAFFLTAQDLLKACDGKLVLLDHQLHELMKLEQTAEPGTPDRHGAERALARVSMLYESGRLAFVRSTLPDSKEAPLVAFLKRADKEIVIAYYSAPPELPQLPAAAEPLLLDVEPLLRSCSGYTRQQGLRLPEQPSVASPDEYDR